MIPQFDDISTLDTFRGGDPRCFRPDWRSLVREHDFSTYAFHRHPFTGWVECCEEADAGPTVIRKTFPDSEGYEDGTRDLPPYSDRIVVTDDGMLDDASGSMRPFCHFGIGLNGEGALDGRGWRAYAELLRPYVLRAAVWWLYDGLDRAIASSECPMPILDEEDIADGMEQHTVESWAKACADGIAEYRARIAKAESDLAEWERVASDGERTPPERATGEHDIDWNYACRRCGADELDIDAGDLPCEVKP